MLRQRDGSGARAQRRPRGRRAAVDGAVQTVSVDLQIVMMMMNMSYKSIMPSDVFKKIAGWQ